MNKPLHKVIDKIGKNYEPFYFRDGNFTICVLMSRRAQSKIVAVGVAKRNPDLEKGDPVDLPERGREIALARAVKKAGDK